MKTFLKFFLAFLLLLVLCGCPWKNPWLSLNDKTPKEKVVYFTSIYNQQYDDYLYVSSLEGLTEEQKEALRTKKKLLINLQDAITAYDFFVVANKDPTPEAEAKVMQLINDLLYGKEDGNGPSISGSIEAASFWLVYACQVQECNFGRDG